MMKKAKTLCMLSAVLFMACGSRGQERADREQTIVERLGVDTEDWRAVFSACLGKMMAIQSACSEHVVQGQAWNLDFSEGTIRFGECGYPVQFLGSESASSETWLWGWENINGFPNDLIRTARQAETLGRRWNLEPLTTAQIPLDETLNGYTLSIVACGTASDEVCYYRCPHSGGAVFVAVSGLPAEVFAPVDSSRFLALTMQSIRQFEVDHRIFAEGFLLWNGTEYEWDGDTLTARFRDASVRLEFERAGDTWRIRSMKSE